MSGVLVLIVAITLTLTFETMAYENSLDGKHFLFSGINVRMYKTFLKTCKKLQFKFVRTFFNM